MATEDVVLSVQPSFKNYVRHWLVALAGVALAVVAGVYRTPVGQCLIKTFSPKAQSTPVVSYAIVACVALAVVVILVMLWKRASLTLRVHEDRIVIERGILAKNMKELFITDIRTIDINQSIFQRVMGTGDLAISTPGVSQTKDVLQGFPDPASIKDTIIRLRQQKKQEDVKPEPKPAAAAAVEPEPAPDEEAEE